MAKEKKVLLLGFPRWGHASLTTAVAAALANLPLTVQVQAWLKETAASGGYQFIYRFAPWAFQPFYRLGEVEKAQKIIGAYFWRRFAHRWRQQLLNLRPDLVITTYWGYLPILDRLSRQGIMPAYFNVVADPVTPSALAYSRQGINLGFGREFIRRGRQLGLKSEQLRPIGWLTRPEFFRRYSLAKVRHQFGLEPDLFTVLFCGGSEGDPAILKLLPWLFFRRRWPRRWQILFISGHNRRLATLVRHSYQLGQYLGKPPRLVVKGFCQQMAAAIAASDLVVGKAGPNLIFETVAQKKPFLVLSHIHGQEDGNLSLVENYGLGWVAESRRRFLKLFNQFLRQPPTCPRPRRCQQIANYNRQAWSRLQQLVLAVVNHEN